MVQTLEDIKGGGGSIKIGTTGTISALMSKELQNATPDASNLEPKEATVDTSLKARVQAHETEASSSNTTTTEKIKPHKTRKANRNPNRRKGSYIVEVVDIKCKMPDPITNRFKKLNFSKLSEANYSISCIMSDATVPFVPISTGGLAVVFAGMDEEEDSDLHCIFHTLENTNNGDNFMYFQVSIDLRRFRHKLDSQFVGVHRRLGFCKPTSRIGPSSNGSKSTCWFKLGKNGVDAEVAGIYGSQSRDDFDRDDVEQYFNYMGMLAVEGTYDKMEAILCQNIHPVDTLQMMAASERYAQNHDSRFGQKSVNLELKKDDLRSRSSSSPSNAIGLVSSSKWLVKLTQRAIFSFLASDSQDRITPISGVG
ncbi:hypothetical protein E3N88_26207 [Mikania micrantha]|uniref:Uncharacterized protein n=1 Tax=Mikania micrantha TaxID=192012 RepID=A0A5N6N9P9_9ASTR|nr:hypothetical protein E3N88_26207 [Mikania micrantha]